MMLMTNHAKKRLLQRKLSISMLEGTFDVFLKIGRWDQKGERLTLNTNTDEFHNLITLCNEEFRKARNEYLRCKRISGKFCSEFSRKRLEQLKSVYRKCKNRLGLLKRLEHKCHITLVISSAGCLITAFKRTRHFKRDVRIRR